MKREIVKHEKIRPDITIEIARFEEDKKSFFIFDFIKYKYVIYVNGVNFVEFKPKDKNDIDLIFNVYKSGFIDGYIHRRKEEEEKEKIKNTLDKLNISS